MKDFKAIVFDMDGVILDSESVSDITWDAAAKEFNIPMTPDVLNSCRGSNRNDIMAKLSGIYGPGFDADGFLTRTGELFTEIENTKGIPLLPYAAEALAALKQKYRIALASSTRGVAVKRQLTATNVIQYFEQLTTGEQVVHSKPDPEIYLMACQKLQLDPSECIAIEDSLNGIRSAHAAGLFTIMVPDKIQPTEEIKPLCNLILPNLKEVMEKLISN